MSSLSFDTPEELGCFAKNLPDGDGLKCWLDKMFSMIGVIKSNLALRRALETEEQNGKRN